MKTLYIIQLLLLSLCIAYGQAPLNPEKPTSLPVDKITSSKTNYVSVIINGKRVDFKDYSSTQYEAWRFITDGEVLLSDIFYMGGTTYSPYKIIECKTLDIATNEIKEMRLKLTEEQRMSISNLVEEVKKQSEDDKK